MDEQLVVEHSAADNHPPPGRAAVGDELERAIRLDRGSTRSGSGATRTGPRSRPQSRSPRRASSRCAAAVIDRAVPAKAEVAVAGAHGSLATGSGWTPGPWRLSCCRRTGTPSRAALDELGAEHVAVERVRAVPVRDRDDAVVESNHTEMPYASVNASWRVGERCVAEALSPQLGTPAVADDEAVGRVADERDGVAAARGLRLVGVEMPLSSPRVVPCARRRRAGSGSARSSRASGARRPRPPWSATG